jgi:hypothetical protein
MTEPEFQPWDGILDDVGDARAMQVRRIGTLELADGTGGSFLAYQAQQSMRECNAAFHAGTATFRHVLDEKAAAVFQHKELAKLDRALVDMLEVGVRWLEDVRRRRGTL